MEQENEIWKPVLINSEASYYEISTFGRIRSNYKGEFKIRSMGDNGHGYYSLSLSHNGVKYQHKPHRLVAEYFLENPNNLPEVNHKDTIKTNNHVTNLEWSTKKENAEHAGKMGKLVRGRRKLPPKPIGKYFAGILLKKYPSGGSLKKDGYPRVSVDRAIRSDKNYKGFFWKYLD
jgi:hypothetical protein